MGLNNDITGSKNEMVMGRFDRVGSAGDTVFFISENIRSISIHAFENRSDLTNVSIPGNVKRIGGYAFAKCPNLKRVIIHEGVEEIGESAFSGCTSLEEIIIPDSVNTIEWSAFFDCVNLYTVHLPVSLTTVPMSCFANSGIWEILLPDSVTAIEWNAFECTPLTSIKLPPRLRTLEAATFANCEHLTKITVPDSVKTIDFSCFSGCKRLSIEFSGTISEWNRIEKADEWIEGTGGVHVFCKDGMITEHDYSDDENDYSQTIDEE